MLQSIEVQNFNKKLKTYNKTICDKRVFKLIQESLNGNFFITNNEEELTILDENVLSLNEKNIAFKLSKSKNFNLKLSESIFISPSYLLVSKIILTKYASSLLG